MPTKIHGRATTTPAIRKKIQESTESADKLAKRFGINRKTVYRWRKRDHVEDLRPGPESKSKSLTREEEAAVIAFRKHTMLPLDDCYFALRKTIPHLSRSTLHRCFQRSGVSRLPHLDKPKRKKKAFKQYAPGFVHVL